MSGGNDMFCSVAAGAALEPLDWGQVAPETAVGTESLPTASFPWGG